MSSRSTLKKFQKCIDCRKPSYLVQCDACVERAKNPPPSGRWARPWNPFAPRPKQAV